MAWGLGKKNKDEAKKDDAKKPEPKANVKAEPGAPVSKAAAEPKAAEPRGAAAANGKANALPAASVAAGPAAKDVKPEGARKLAAAQAMAETARKARFAQSFAQAIGVLMRDATYRNLLIKDLEYVLVPAIVAQQSAVGYTQASGEAPAMPVALALWAKVSPAIDKRLTENLDQPMAIRPTEWTSGEHYWIMTLAGAPSQFNDFLKQLLSRQFKGKTVKMRLTDKNGKRSVKVLQG